MGPDLGHFLGSCLPKRQKISHLQLLLFTPLTARPLSYLGKQNYAHAPFGAVVWGFPDFGWFPRVLATLSLPRKAHRLKIGASILI